MSREGKIKTQHTYWQYKCLVKVKLYYLSCKNTFTDISELLVFSTIFSVPIFLPKFQILETRGQAKIGRICRL